MNPDLQNHLEDTSYSAKAPGEACAVPAFCVREMGLQQLQFGKPTLLAMTGLLVKMTDLLQSRSFLFFVFFGPRLGLGTRPDVSGLPRLLGAGSK